MSINKIRIEDDAGNVLHPHTTTDVVFRPDGSSLESALITYKDVTNLSATTAGVISWLPYSSNDATMTDIVLYRATKDISNYDYKTCSGDSSVVGQQVSKDTKSYSYTGLTNNTQYWVKVFVRYQIGGGIYYSNGVTVTFTTPSVTITEFYNAGNEFTAITGGWKQGLMGNSPPSVTTKATNYLEVMAEAPSESGQNGYATLVTTNQIDLTNIKTLKIDWEGIFYLGGTQGTRAFSISDNPDGVSPTITSITFNSLNFSRATYTLDVSSIMGTHYISTSAYSKAGTRTTQGRKTRVYRVWGES